MAAGVMVAGIAAIGHPPCGPIPGPRGSCVLVPIGGAKFAMGIACVLAIAALAAAFTARIRPRFSSYCALCAGIVCFVFLLFTIPAQPTGIANSLDATLNAIPWPFAVLAGLCLIIEAVMTLRGSAAPVGSGRDPHPSD